MLCWYICAPVRVGVLSSTFLPGSFACRDGARLGGKAVLEVKWGPAELGC